jgi:hypothetical protein
LLVNGVIDVPLAGRKRNGKQPNRYERKTTAFSGLGDADHIPNVTCFLCRAEPDRTTTIQTPAATIRHRTIAFPLAAALE